MIPQRFRRLSRAVLGGFLIGSSLIGHAQEQETPGIVRITDSRPKGVPIRNAGFKGEYHHTQGGYSDGYYADDDCDDCKHGHHGKHCNLFREHYCKYPSDYGYTTPEKLPIYRRVVQYNQYFPNAWYGTPNGGIAPGVAYPQIYQPTDTTQLGFYYQHVPFWQPNPNALPPRPIPAQWHRLNPSYKVPWSHGGGFGGYGYGQGGAYCPPGVDGTYATPTPTPVQTLPQAAPPAQDAAPMPVPNPPKNDSALNLHIRRAGFRR